MTITAIEIKNVKGIQNETFALRLMPDKPNLIVAPNGSGKSSIAAAFACMNRNRMKLEENDCYQCDEANAPALHLTVEDDKKNSSVLIADSNNNDILKQFDVEVIRSGLCPKGKRTFKGGVSAQMEIENITIDRIPPKTAFDYSCSDFRRAFGANGKILPNIGNLLEDMALPAALASCDLAKCQGKRVQKKIKSLVMQINDQAGAAENIRQSIQDKLLPSFRAINPLKALADGLRNVDGITSEADAYLAALQIVDLFGDMGNRDFQKAVQWLGYSAMKSQYDGLLQEFRSSTWEWAKLTEDKKKGTLSVTFPPAHQLSNGQRDLITLLIQMHRTLYAGGRKPLILVIDEVFDYLDDANLVAFQYYVTRLIEEYKRKQLTLYPIILTHLDPGVFFDFCFNKHKLHIHYLRAQSNSMAKNTTNLIQARDTEAGIKDKLEEYWFHFHPDSHDIEEQDWPKRLPVDWRHSSKFHGYASDQLGQYLAGDAFDPLAVCFAVRILVEQSAYKLVDKAYQSNFLSKRGTRVKLEYAAQNLHDIPETFFLLGLIYNTNMHWKQNRDYVTPLINKLEHPSIKAMIRSVKDGAPNV